jgi:hypothetical protein
MRDSEEAVPPEELERQIEILAELIRARYHDSQDGEEWQEDVEDVFDNLDLTL